MTIEYAGILMGAFVLALVTIVIVVLLWRGMEVCTDSDGERQGCRLQEAG